MDLRQGSKAGLRDGPNGTYLPAKWGMGDDMEGASTIYRRQRGDERNRAREKGYVAN